MGRLFSYDSPIMQSINKIVDCVILSFLWLIFSIPIVTIGASSTALYYTVNKVIRHNRSHVWREFWGSFKSNFKQATIIWLILIVLYYLLGVDCIFVYNLVKAGTVGVWLLAPFVVTAVLVTMWMLYMFGYMARFYNNMKGIMKNCALLVIRHLLRSVLVALVFAASMAIFLFFPVTVVILPVGGIYLMNLSLESIFVKYMTEEDLEAEAERNQVYYN